MCLASYIPTLYKWHGHLPGHVFPSGLEIHIRVIIIHNINLLFLNHYGYYYYYVWFFTCTHIQFFLHLTFLIIGSHNVFISLRGLLNRSLKPNVFADSLRRLIPQCSSLSIILTSSHKGWWFLFSVHIWFAISNFLISPLTTAFSMFF